MQGGTPQESHIEVRIIGLLGSFFLFLILRMEPEFAYMSLLHFISAIGGFLNFQLEPLIKAHYGHQLFTSTIPLVMWFMNTLVYDSLGLPKFWSGFSGLTCPNVRIYIDTAAVVLISYGSLLLINLMYIKLVLFPAIALALIVALCIELNCQSRSQGDHNGEPNSGCTSSTGTDKDEKAIKKAEELKAISVVPYWVLCVMGQFHHAANKYAVSQFLLFLSSTMGALTLMLRRLPAGIAPGIAPASELLHKTSLILLLVTVHTVAAESLGKDVVLFCMPEVVPVLLLFRVHLDHGVRGSSIISVDRIKSCKNWLIVLSAVVAAVFAYLGASMGESGLSRCTRTLVSCGVSGLLIYYVVFMLRQWPGQAGMATPSLEEAIQLLRFWANVLLIAAAALMVLTSFAAARLGLPEPTVAALAKLFGEYSE